jgi:hypothetical protein
MENLTYNHKLNEVLRYLNRRTQPPKATISEVVKDLEPALNSDESELLLLLDKLVKDGYVDAYSTQMNRVLSDEISYKHDVRYYIINIDGKSFINERGGYGKGTFNPDLLTIMSTYKLNQVLGDLLDKRPTNTPPIELKKTHVAKYQKGTPSKSIWKNELMLYIVYPILAILIALFFQKYWELFNN